MKPNLIELSEDKKASMLNDIKIFFLQERNEDLGDLAAEIVLDFVIKKLANEFYNQGIDDAYTFYNERMLDVLELQK